MRGFYQFLIRKYRSDFVAKYLNIVIIFILQCSTVLAVENKPSSVERFTENLKSINQTQTSNCTDCAIEGKEKSCSDFLERMHRDDVSKIITLDGGAKKCYEAVEVPGTAGRFKNASEFQLQLQRKFSDLGTVNHGQIRSCILGNKDPDSIQRLKISKFYYFMSKLDSAAKTAYEEMAKINNLLSETTPMKCTGGGSINGAFNRCKELNNQCLPRAIDQGEVSELALKAKETDQDKAIYLESEKQIRKLETTCLNEAQDYAKYGQSLSEQQSQKNICQDVFVERQSPKKICKVYTYARQQEIRKCEETKDNLEIAKLALEDKNPWFRDKKFFKNSNNKPTQELIKDFMLNRKHALQKKIKEFQNSALCLNGFLDSAQCNLDKVRESLSLTPEISMPKEKNPSSLALQAYLNAQTCVEIKNEFNIEAVKALQEGGIDIFLILATAGASTIYNGAKLAKNAATAGKALAGLTALNLVFATKSFKDASKACGPFAEKIELAKSQNTNQCPSSKSNLAKAEADHASCMIAVAFAAIDAAAVMIPFAGMAAKYLKDRNIKSALSEDLKIITESKSTVSKAKQSSKVPSTSSKTVAEIEEIKKSYDDVLKDFNDSDKAEIAEVIAQARAKGISDKEIRNNLEATCNLK